jgi:hypothetical protein
VADRLEKEVESKALLILRNLISEDTHPETQMRSELVVRLAAQRLGVAPGAVLNYLIQSTSDIGEE